MADEYDFQIDDLKFRAAISDDFPYQRATAPFRKEQFDSAPTVGDQSLTGWWTRGQLSFHKGAGLKYYEVLDGEAILNRYQDSNAVNVWEPGQVTLIPDLADLAVSAESATPGTLSGVSGLFYANATGMSFFDGTTTTAITTSDGGVPTDVTSDGRYYLAVNGRRIEKQSYSGSQRTNYIPNPSFEAGTTGWTGASMTLAVDATKAVKGTQCMKVTCTSASGNSSASTSPLVGLTVGQVYVMSAYLYLPSGTDGIEIAVGDLTTTATTSVRDAWVRVSRTFTATSTNPSFLLSQDSAKGGANGDVFYVDAVMVTEFPFDGEYFDGATLGAEWTGAANASTSTYGTDAPASSFALWELATDGHEFTRAWWAKGRVWAVDNTGRWYTLSPAGGTVGMDAALWTSGKTEASWSLADTPGAVFMADSGTIYALTVDVDGAAINLQAPVVAGVLPAGEIISCLGYYLGRLVIATNKGVRVAQVGAGQLIYGPLVIEGDFSKASQIGAAGNLAYVVGLPEGKTAITVCSLDLTQEVESLKPAWSPWMQLNGASSVDPAGALVDPSGRLFVWAGDLYGSGADLAPAGRVDTGYHRFGTLDPKSFQSVSVRCGGDGGKISVSMLDANGVVTSLGEITPSEAAKDFDLSGALTGPTERIALRFILTPSGLDPTAGPELLGYQLKALPVPKRQRILKWPLALTDQVRSRYGKALGRRGKGWGDVQALEALESSAAVVTFTDHRTGETGSAYIDSVEFVSNTPSLHNDNGFGGIAYLALRVID